jgi:hypothetical protein
MTSGVARWSRRCRGTVERVRGRQRIARTQPDLHRLLLAESLHQRGLTNARLAADEREPAGGARLDRVEMALQSRELFAALSRCPPRHSFRKCRHESHSRLGGDERAIARRCATARWRPYARVARSAAGVTLPKSPATRALIRAAAGWARTSAVRSVEYGQHRSPGDVSRDSDATGRRTQIGTTAPQHRWHVSAMVRPAPSHRHSRLARVRRSGHRRRVLDRTTMLKDSEIGSGDSQKAERIIENAAS